MFADQVNDVIAGSPWRPVRYEGIDGCVGHCVLVHSLGTVTNDEPKLKADLSEHFRNESSH